MTSTTDEMLALIEKAHEAMARIGEGDWTPQDMLLLHVTNALHAAAKQTDAIRQYVIDGEVEDDNGQHVVYTHGLAPLLDVTADTASQDGRDG